jgi:hypothetical protein
MKKKLFQILLVLSIIGTALAGAFTFDFKASAQGDNVRLEWKTQEESNLKNFVIERKTQQSSYVDLTTINPKGSNSSYSFIDEAVYKSSGYVFTYRLRIVDQDETISYSSELSVTPNPSGVKQTWGGIKALFR